MHEKLLCVTWQSYSKSGRMTKAKLSTLNIPQVYAHFTNRRSFLGLASCKIGEEKDRFFLVGQRFKNLFTNVVEVNPNNEGSRWLIGFGLWLE